MITQSVFRVEQYGDEWRVGTPEFIYKYYRTEQRARETAEAMNIAYDLGRADSVRSREGPLRPDAA